MRIPKRFKIRIEVCIPNELKPAVRYHLELFGVHAFGFGTIKQFGGYGIVVAAHHARNVFERRMLDFAVGDAALRLAFKVNDDIVLPRGEYLPEVVVAVNAYPQRVERAVE